MIVTFASFDGVCFFFFSKNHIFNHICFFPLDMKNKNFPELFADAYNGRCHNNFKKYSIHKYKKIKYTFVQRTVVFVFSRNNRTRYMFKTILRKPICIQVVNYKNEI